MRGFLALESEGSWRWLAPQAELWKKALPMLRSPVAEHIPTPGDLLEDGGRAYRAVVLHQHRGQGRPVIAVSAATWRAIRNKLAHEPSGGRRGDD